MKEKNLLNCELDLKKNESSKAENEKRFLITEVTRSDFALVEVNDLNEVVLKEELRGILKRSNFREDKEIPVIGDYVYGTLISREEVLITSIDYLRNDRRILGRNILSRSAFSTGEVEAICSNCDYLFIFTSMNFDFNLRRLIRFVQMAKGASAIPVIILTKMDLAADRDYFIRECTKTFPQIDIIPVSTVTMEGIENLEKYMIKDKTIALAGTSGVGKSTLVNALAGFTIMKTGSIREDDSRGRHTTTSRKMIILDNGVRIIDMPGIRSVEAYSLGDDFNEGGKVESLATQCRYSNCTHNGEKGCAIKEALENGSITEEEYENWLYDKKLQRHIRKKERIQELRKDKMKKVKYDRHKKIRYDY